MRMRGFVKRWRTQILCVLGGFLLYAAVSGMPSDGVGGGYLERGDYGTGTATHEFYVEGLADEPVLCRTDIPARQYTDAEAEEVFGKLLDSLPDRIRGENESLSRVETDLVLPDSLEGGITAEWYSDAPELLDSFGTVLSGTCPEEGAGVWLTVELSDGVHRGERTYAVTVCPKTLTEKERLSAAIAEEIRRESERTPSDPAVKLPETYEGRRLRYYPQENDGYEAIPALGIGLAALLYARGRNREAEERKRRRQRLQLDYADVVYQLMVYIGAGLTVPRAWERIVRGYEERRKEGRVPIRPAYEEMADAQSQMQCGVLEGQAIIRFGQRCGLQSYLKLSSLLEQNRRTGTKNLTQLLHQEMGSAWEQQKTAARRLGEEAGTKLMLPLLLQLLVVMVIVMVPAMISMR